MELRILSDTAETRREIRLLYGIASANFDQGWAQSAISYCKDAIEIVKQRLGNEDLYLASLNIFLARIYINFHEGNTFEATSLVEEALQIRRLRFGEEHAEVAAAYNMLAILNELTGNVSEAESLFLKAIGIRKRVLGEHADLASNLCDFGVFCMNTNLQDMAQAKFTKAVGIYKSVAPDNHNMSKALSCLALVYFRKGKGFFGEAGKLYKEIMTIAHVKEYGPIGLTNKSFWEIAEEKEVNQLGRGSTVNGSVTFSQNSRSEIDSRIGSPSANLDLIPREERWEREFNEILDRTIILILKDSTLRETVKYLSFVYTFQDKGEAAKSMQMLLRKASERCASDDQFL